MSETVPPPPVLPYQAPPRKTPRHRPIFAAVVGLAGVLSGLFGTLMLFYAAVGIVYLPTHSVRRDLPGDLFELFLFLLIGVVCLTVAVRWCRAVRGIASGRPPQRRVPRPDQ